MPEYSETGRQIEDAEEITDPTEKRFAEISLSQGLILEEPGMITLDRRKRNKWDKLSTVPDFLLKNTPDDEGIYIEITIKNKGSRKTGQLRVMEEAGLGHRYVQLTNEDMDQMKELGVYIYCLDQITARINDSQNE